MTTKKPSKFQQLTTDKRTVTLYRLSQNRRRIREQQAARVQPKYIKAGQVPAPYDWRGNL